MARLIALAMLLVIGVTACAQQQYRRQQDAWQVAFAKAQDCYGRYEAGEIASLVATTACSDDAFVRELSAAEYPYMDLVALFLAHRRAIAARVDLGQVTLDEAGAQLQEALVSLNDEIIRRNQQLAQTGQAQQDQGLAMMMLGLGILSANQQPRPVGVFQPAPAGGGVANGPAFLQGSYTSGFNKICNYNRMGSPVAITVGATELCPITLP